MCTVQSHGSSQGYSHKMSAHSVENMIKSGNLIVSSKFLDCLFLIDVVSQYEKISDVVESRVRFASKNLTPCRVH